MDNIQNRSWLKFAPSNANFYKNGIRLPTTCSHLFNQNFSLFTLQKEDIAILKKAVWSWHRQMRSFIKTKWHSFVHDLFTFDYLEYPSLKKDLSSNGNLQKLIIFFEQWTNENFSWTNVNKSWTNECRLVFIKIRIRSGNFSLFTTDIYIVNEKRESQIYKWRGNVGNSIVRSIFELGDSRKIQRLWLDCPAGYWLIYIFDLALYPSSIMSLCFRFLLLLTSFYIFWLTNRHWQELNLLDEKQSYYFLNGNLEI